MEKIRALKMKISDMFGKAAGLKDYLVKIAAPIWSFLTRSPLETVLPLSVICVSVSSGRVDVTRVKRALSRLRVLSSRTFEHAAETFPTPDEVAADAAIFAKELGVKKNDAVLVIPRSWVMYKKFELPAAVKSEIDQVINYEFDRFTPLSASEAAYDFIYEPKNSESLNVYLAAAKASVVNEYIEKLADRSILVKKVVFDISALADFFRFTSGIKSGFFALVAVKGCSGGFYDGATLKGLAYRDFAYEDDNSKAEEIESLIEDLKKTTPEASEVSSAFLSLADAAGQLKEAIMSRTKIAFRSANEFMTRIKGALELDIFQNITVGAAIGYLYPSAGGFDLLSKGARGRAKGAFLLSYILIGVALLSAALYVFVPLKSERERLEEIDRQIAQRRDEVTAIEKIRSEIDAINKKMEIVERFKNSGHMRIDLMKELTAIIPANTWLTRVRIVEDKINIEGYAQSATSLVQLLEASKYFRNVEFATPTFRDPQMNMDRFQIKMELKEMKKEEPHSEKK